MRITIQQPICFGTIAQERFPIRLLAFEIFTNDIEFLRPQYTKVYQSVSVFVGAHNKLKIGDITHQRVISESFDISVKNEDGPGFGLIAAQ